MFFLARIIILCYGPILSKIGPSFGTFLVVSYFYFYIFSSPISIVRVLEWWVDNYRPFQAFLILLSFTRRSE